MKHTVLLQHCILCKYPRDNTAEHKNILKEILKTSWKTDRVYMTYTSSTKAAIQYDYQCINGIKTLSETWDSAVCEMNNRQEQGCTTHLLWNWTRPLRHRTPNAAHVSWTWLLSQHLTLEEKSHHTIVHINSPNSSIFQFQYPNSAPQRNPREVERALRKHPPAIWKLSYYRSCWDQQEDAEESQEDAKK